ncbi:MAG TPA: hypothetical protein VG944_23475 [Fimbriimonas sp.]|nr:hypothetical protein [Fimbriimonas sp.]
MLKLTLPLLAAALCFVLVACGGSGGGGNGSSATAGSTATTSTTAGTSYATTPMRTDCFIMGYSSNGHFAGQMSDASGRKGVYGASLSASLQTLQSPAGETDVAAYMVSSLGAILGRTHFSGGASNVLLYWSSATAVPKALALPSGVTAMFPLGINKQNQILARNDAGAGVGDIYFYSSPDAAPVKFWTASSEKTYGYLIDSGTIVIRDFDAQTVNVYTSPTANPVRLKLLSGAFASEVRSVGPTGIILDSLTLCYWSPDDYSTPRSLKLPSGATSGFALSSNSSGQISGQFGAGVSDLHACIWPNGDSKPIDLVGAGGSVVQTLNHITIVFDDGTLLASHETQSSATGDLYFLVPKPK